MKKLSKKEWIAVAVAVIFVSYTLFGADIIRLFQDSATMDENPAAVAVPDIPSNVGVIINDTKIGTGPEIKNGELLTVNYILSLSDGTVIQNSQDLGRPFQFVLGAGEVIQGWEQGFAGMKVGGTRVIIVPPELGYGAQQAGPIPPNSTLVFMVELLSVQDLTGQQ